MLIHRFVLQYMILLHLILHVSCFFTQQLLCCNPNRPFKFHSKTVSQRNDIQNDNGSEIHNDNDIDNDTTTEENMTLLTKASWYGVEAFGKVFGSKSDNTASIDPTVGKSIDLTQPPTCLQETLDRIQLDNDRSYFLSGNVDTLIYDEKCIFSDPFVAFEGRDRFVDNLANLGSFITKYSAKLLSYQTEGTTVTTKVMVKLELNLPWKPVLAWPWGVTYEIDEERFVVITHRESWDIEPLEGVKQIFRKPTTQIK